MVKRGALLASLLIVGTAFGANMAAFGRITTGNFSASSPTTVSMNVSFPATITVAPASGDTCSVTFSAAGNSTNPVNGLTSITAPTSVTLPSRISTVTFTTTSGSGTDSFEIDAQ